MLQICQLSKLRISSLFEKAARSNFIPTRSLISGNKMYNVCSFWFVCVRPKIGLVICRKPHHTERLCTGDEREHSHLTAIRDPSCFCFFFFLSVTVSATMRVSFLLHGCRPPLLSVHTVLLCRCQYSHSPPSNPGYATQETHNMRPVLNFRGRSGNPNPFHG